jgi:hypothetical protein
MLILCFNKADEQKKKKRDGAPLHPGASEKIL